MSHSIDSEAAVTPDYLPACFQDLFGFIHERFMAFEQSFGASFVAYFGQFILLAEFAWRAGVPWRWAEAISALLAVITGFLIALATKDATGALAIALHAIHTLEEGIEEPRS